METIEDGWNLPISRFILNASICLNQTIRYKYWALRRYGLPKEIVLIILRISLNLSACIAKKPTHRKFPRYIVFDTYSRRLRQTYELSDGIRREGFHIRILENPTTYQLQEWKSNILIREGYYDYDVTKVPNFAARYFGGKLPSGYFDRLSSTGLAPLNAMTEYEWLILKDKMRLDQTDPVNVIRTSHAHKYYKNGYLTRLFQITDFAVNALLVQKYQLRSKHSMNQAARKYEIHSTIFTCAYENLEPVNFSCRFVSSIRDDLLYAGKKECGADPIFTSTPAENPFELHPLLMALYYTLKNGL